MIRSPAILAASLLATPLVLAQDDHGQGPVKAGLIQVADLNLGTHWFGPEIDQKDLVGKVVLVEIWGS